MKLKKNDSSAMYGVIGLGRFGTALVKTLAEAGEEVIAIDKNEERVREVRAYTDYAFVVDNLTEAALKETGMQNCATVVVCIGEQVDMSILTTMLVIKLGVPNVLSKATSEVHGEVLKRMGATVVYPEADMAVRIGRRLIYGNLLDYVALADGVEVRRIAISPWPTASRCAASPSAARCWAAPSRNWTCAAPMASTSSPSSAAATPMWSSAPTTALSRGIPSPSWARTKRSTALNRTCCRNDPPPGPHTVCANPPPAELPAAFYVQNACFLRRFALQSWPKCRTIKPMIPHGAAGAAAPDLPGGALVYGTFQPAAAGPGQPAEIHHHRRGHAAPDPAQLRKDPHGLQL